MIRLDPPGPNEIEITLLGRGVGESCVVHYGRGDWLIVDSFNYKRRPVALSYLERLGVSPASVRHLVVTHFDSDHYRGIDQLHDACSGARLWVSAAFNCDWFLKIYGAHPHELGLNPVVQAIAQAKKRKLASTISGMARLAVGTHIIEDPDLKIRAIAPSEAAVEASNEALAAVAGMGVAVIRRSLAGCNESSVALHFEMSGVCAILCGDVVSKPDEFGWRAVLEEPRNASLNQASLVKVPHHGSAGAHENEMWDKLVSTDATMLVAPFSASKIPSPGDQARLLRYGRLWQAAPSSGKRVVRGDLGVSVYATRSGAGMIRARCVPGSSWYVVAEPPAFEVQ